MRQKIQQEGFMTPRQVFTHLVIQALEAGSVLKFSISGTSQRPWIELPSWVPDLSSVSNFVDTTHYHHAGRFSAGSSFTADYALSVDGRELRMPGVLLDVINAYSLSILDQPANPNSGAHSDNLNVPERALRLVDLADLKFRSRFRLTWRSVFHFVRQHVPNAYMDNMDSQEALCRTIIEDGDPTTHEPMDESSWTGAKDMLARLASDVLGPLERKSSDSQDTATMMRHRIAANLMEDIPEPRGLSTIALAPRSCSDKWPSHLRASSLPFPGARRRATWFVSSRVLRRLVSCGQSRKDPNGTFCMVRRTSKAGCTVRP
jgi:hypothetical protein